MLGVITLRLEERLRSLAGTSQAVRLDHVFNAFAGDVIGQICLGSTSSDTGFLDDRNFAPEWYIFQRNMSFNRLTDSESRFDVIHAIVRSLPLFTAFPFLVR
jgi:hypothetical protein